MKHEDLIVIAYEAFNRRDIDSVLVLLHPEVEWPNGWEGGYVYGHEQVRAYWTRQWKELDPFVKPVAFKALDDGTLEVTVRQVVKDMEGSLLVDGTIHHVYNFQEGLVKKMVIVAAEPGA